MLYSCLIKHVSHSLYLLFLLPCLTIRDIGYNGAPLCLMFIYTFAMFVKDREDIIGKKFGKVRECAICYC